MARATRSEMRGEAAAGRWYSVGRALLPGQAYHDTEVLGGAVLLAAATVALIWANSPLAGTYFRLRDAELVLDLGLFRIEESVQDCINDALMTAFFFVVGLEIKRDFTHGELSTRSG